MYNGMITSDTDISFLIERPKIFKTAPKKPAQINRNISQSFKVYGKDSNLEFPVFITYSERMPQDFSLGLRYGNVLLLRCNGFHGTTRSGYYSAEHHAYPHCHMLSMTDIEAGRSLKPSNIQDLTGEFIDLQTAIAFFCEKCGIIDYGMYFPVNQIRLSNV